MIGSNTDKTIDSWSFSDYTNKLFYDSSFDSTNLLKSVHNFIYFVDIFFSMYSILSIYNLVSNLIV